MVRTIGQVYLVGAGLGNIAYLTRGAEELLKQAEAIVYDALVDEQILQLAPQNCQQFYVGKRGGKPSWSQAEINTLLVSQCQEGKQVVRLKGGDPFIFGRCTAEIMALQDAGCCFEVVPGISSAFAAPELAGIPLTDPVLSRSFTVISGHEPADLDWETLSQLETLVILMGTRQLPEIIHQLLRHDRSPNTPIAIIHAAGTANQAVWTGTLRDILETTRGLSLSPAAIAIGEVVRLRDYLHSPDRPTSISATYTYATFIPDRYTSTTSTTSTFAMSDRSLPLTGTTILVTRSAGQSSVFRDRLEQVGATVAEMPALEISPPSSWEDLDRAIAHLDTYHWLILTSSNGVDYFFDRLLTQGKDARHLAGIKIAVVGKKTAASLSKRGLQPDFIPPNFVADSLVAEFPEAISGKNILFPRVETGGREVLVAEFTAAGANVAEVAAYQSGCPKKIDPAIAHLLQQRQVNVITFASSKTVQYFCQLLTQELESGQSLNPGNNPGDRLDSKITKNYQDLENLLSNVCLASIGPQTSKTCINLLGRVDVEAEEYTLDGLTQAIIRWSSHRQQPPH